MIDEGKSEIEGQAPGDVPSAAVVELSPDAVNQSIELIEEGIIETDITPQNAPMFGRRYLQYAIKSYESIHEEKPMPVLDEYVEFLRDTLQEAEANDFENLARFLRAQGEIHRNGLKEPQHIRENTLGLKLTQIADTLTSNPPPAQPPAPSS